jgi:hypothetical protein
MRIRGSDNQYVRAAEHDATSMTAVFPAPKKGLE